ncbi:unnamed protein product, partial [Rotaria sordida]
EGLVVPGINLELRNRLFISFSFAASSDQDFDERERLDRLAFITLDILDLLLYASDSIHQL